MRKIVFLACLLLTMVALHTCIRIELLNASCNYYLPRTDWGSANQKWRISARPGRREWLEYHIAKERHSRFIAAHPHEQHRDPDQFLGPPYTVAEQKLFDTQLAEDELRAALHG